jgi:hypothetical protein
MGVHSRGHSDLGVKLTAHLHLVPRLGISGAIRLLLLQYKPSLHGQGQHSSRPDLDGDYLTSPVCILVFFPPMVQQPLVGQGLLIIGASRSYSDTPHLVGLLWTSDQPDAETSTSQNATLIRDRHPCPRRDSNPQSQKASGRRPTP